MKISSNLHIGDCYTDNESSVYRTRSASYELVWENLGLAERILERV